MRRSELIGDLKGFPKVIVKRMMAEQKRQGNERNIKLFQECRSSESGRFNWWRSGDGYIFWDKVLTNLDFKTYYKRYPLDIFLC